jgi:hypothetical protein
MQIETSIIYLYRRLKLEFHGTKVTSDGGLLAYRELDDALGLTSTVDSDDELRNELLSKAEKWTGENKTRYVITAFSKTCPQSLSALRVQINSRIISINHFLKG